jgi:hypothetical protein
MMRHLVVGGVVFLVALAVLVLSGVRQAHAILYTITNDTTIDLTVDPLSKAESASAYYDYDTIFYDSGNPDFGTLSNTGFFWLYENTLTGEISLGMIFDTPNDGSGGTVNLSIAGVPGTGYVAVADDPPILGDTFSTSEGSWGWNTCCTDGGVIGGLYDLWDITITLSTSTGIESWYFLSGDSTTPTQIALNMNDNLVISAVPEPSTLLLLGPGLAGLVGLRKRFKGKNS